LAGQAWPAIVGKMFDTNGNYRAAPWMMAAGLAMSRRSNAFGPT
jgi:hypothetical protein